MSDKRNEVPAYKGESWPTDHFIEFAALRTLYHDFIVWRRLKFDGKTIHVDQNGYRRHGSMTDTVADAKVWVFGGSTAWAPVCRTTAPSPPISRRRPDCAPSISPKPATTPIRA